MVWVHFYRVGVIHVGFTTTPKNWRTGHLLDSTPWSLISNNTRRIFTWVASGMEASIPSLRHLYAILFHRYLVWLPTWLADSIQQFVQKQGKGHKIGFVNRRLGSMKLPCCLFLHILHENVSIISVPALILTSLVYATMRLRRLSEFQVW